MPTDHGTALNWDQSHTSSNFLTNRNGICWFVLKSSHVSLLPQILQDCYRREPLYLSPSLIYVAVVSMLQVRPLSFKSLGNTPHNTQQNQDNTLFQTFQANRYSRKRWLTNSPTARDIEQGVPTILGFFQRPFMVKTLFWMDNYTKSTAQEGAGDLTCQIDAIKALPLKSHSNM